MTQKHDYRLCTYREPFANSADGLTRSQQSYHKVPHVCAWMSRPLQHNTTQHNKHFMSQANRRRLMTMLNRYVPLSHGRRYVGGQAGGHVPLFLKVEGSLCVLSLTLLRVDIFVLVHMIFIG